MLPAADTLALIALAPLLLFQARRVRRTALILPEPPGPREGVGSTPGRSLLILGDSSAAGVGAPDQSEALSGQLSALPVPGHDWRLEARTGATTASALAHLARLNPARYATVLVVLGVNDITRLVPLHRLRAQRAQLYQRLRQEFGAERIVISGLPPLRHFPLLPQPLRWVLGRRAARFDVALARQATAMGLTYVRQDMRFDPDYMAKDGFHPAPAAYRLWAQTLAPYLQDT